MTTRHRSPPRSVRTRESIIKYFRGTSARARRWRRRAAEVEQNKTGRERERKYEMTRRFLFRASSAEFLDVFFFFIAAVTTNGGGARYRKILLFCRFPNFPSINTIWLVDERNATAVESNKSVGDNKYGIRFFVRHRENRVAQKYRDRTPARARKTVSREFPTGREKKKKKRVFPISFLTHKHYLSGWTRARTIKIACCSPQRVHV